MRSREATPSLADQPPPPVFKPRDFLIQDRTEVTLLGQTFKLSQGLNWNPPGPRLNAMTLHYMEWIEGLEPRAAQEWINDWIVRNPVTARSAPWAAWNAYALSVRVVVWMQTWARHQWGSAQGTQQAVLNSMVAQLRSLDRRLEVDLGGNHLIKNLKALIWGSAFFTGAEAERWFTRARNLLERELPAQVLPDGLHFERSPAYHLQVFADLLEIRHVWPAGTPHQALDEVLDRMAQVAVDLTHPDGLPSQFSDGGLHMAYLASDCMAVYQSIRNREVTPRPTFFLPEGGYAGIREGASLVLWDVGPIGADHLPAHGHGDMLACEWSLDGHRILVDIGVFEYEPGARRQYSRGTFGHNTVAINGTDQGELWGSFRLGRRSKPCVQSLGFDDGQLAGCAHHEGYRHLPGRPLHHRRILTTGRRIEVQDRVEASTPVVAQVTFLLHPSCRPVGGGVFETPAGRVLFESNAPWKLCESDWFPDFGISCRTMLIVIELAGQNLLHRAVWESLPQRG